MPLLLSIAHNRFDHYIAVKYRDLNAAIIPANKINVQGNSQTLFVVTSKSDSEIQYRVDMDICTCSCPKGMDGSPCVHQTAVVKHHHTVSLNSLILLKLLLWHWVMKQKPTFHFTHPFTNRTMNKLGHKINHTLILSQTSQTLQKAAGILYDKMKQHRYNRVKLQIKRKDHC